MPFRSEETAEKLKGGKIRVLRENRLTEAEVFLVADALAAKNSQLEVVELVNITMAGAKAIAQALRGNKKLRVLRLPKIQGLQLSVLVDEFRHNESVAVYDFGDSAIDMAGKVALEEGFMHSDNKNLVAIVPETGPLQAYCRGNMKTCITLMTALRDNPEYLKGESDEIIERIYGISRSINGMHQLLIKQPALGGDEMWKLLEEARYSIETHEHFFESYRRDEMFRGFNPRTADWTPPRR